MRDRLAWLCLFLTICLTSGEVPSWEDTEPLPGDPPDPATDTVIQRLSRTQSLNKPTQIFSGRQPPLGRLNGLYEPNSWSNPSTDIPGYKQLSGQCRSALRLFVSALANQTLWAARMSDANGRYSSEFLFGNQFWLGSKLLCQVLQLSSPIQSSFHIANLKITMEKSFTPMGSADISLGVCLPSTCSSKDIWTILEAGGASSSGSQDFKLDILQVRPIPGPYSLWADPKFHITGTVLVIMLIFTVVGTVYEGSTRRGHTKLHMTNNNETANVKLAALEKITFQKLDKSESSLSSDSYQQDGLLKRLILCFSALTNGRKILDCGGDSSSESLMCIHGLRFYSLTWVILAHTYLQIFIVAGNKGRKLVAEKNFMFQTVTNATFSVDSFFFISGLLVAYVFFKNTARARNIRRPFFRDINNMACKFATFVGYRFVRLTPAYLFVLICSELSMKWLKNDSVFVPLSMDDVTCDKYWWRNILYINSLFPRSEMCMLWSWYLSNDTQFYVLGIFFLLVSTRYFRTSAVSLFLLLVSSCITCGIIAAKYGYLVRIEDRFMLFDELYDKPWTRLGPYLVGMFTGWFLYSTKSTIRISTTGAVWGWIASLGALIALVYGVRDAQLDVAGSATYVALGHAVWAACLSWIVIACSTGYGGYVSSLLSCPLLHPLGRLTYCAYLVHPIIMRLTSFQMDNALHLSSLISVILFFGNIVAAFLVSFVVSLVFEAPVVRILKIIMPSPSTSRPQQNAEP